jgi:hypothetical protein
MAGILSANQNAPRHTQGGGSDELCGGVGRLSRGTWGVRSSTGWGRMTASTSSASATTSSR